MARRSISSPIDTIIDYFMDAPLAAATGALTIAQRLVARRIAGEIVAPALQPARAPCVRLPAGKVAGQPGPSLVTPVAAESTAPRRRGRPVGSGAAKRSYKKKSTGYPATTQHNPLPALPDQGTADEE